MTQQETASQTRIDVREAVRKARDYIMYLYDGDLPNFLLEEVQLSDDELYWQITFGFDTDQPNNVTDFMGTSTLLARQPKFVRAYKLVTVRASDGEVVSMTIREL